MYICLDIFTIFCFSIMVIIYGHTCVFYVLWYRIMDMKGEVMYRGYEILRKN